VGRLESRDQVSGILIGIVEKPFSLFSGLGVGFDVLILQVPNASPRLGFPLTIRFIFSIL